MYIAWYNTKYKRQAEILTPKERWDEMVDKYGPAVAATLLVAGCYRLKNRKRVTVASQKSWRTFVTGSMSRPDIYGSAVFRVGRSKKEVLHKGKAELRIYSTRDGIHVRRKRRQRPYSR